MSRLVATIREAELRLQELTGGQVDAVVDATGGVHLLPEGQQALQREVEHQSLLAATRTALLNVLPSAVALIDADGTILDVNEAWHRFAHENGGDPRRTGVGMNYFAVCSAATGADAAYAEQVRLGLDALLRGAVDRFTLEYPCHAPDEQRWFQLVASPAGEAVRGGAVVMHVDITDLEVTQRALRHTVEISKATFEQAAVGIAHVGLDGRLLRVNDAFCTFLGYSREELVGRHVAELTEPDDIPMSHAATRDVLEGRAERISLRKRYRRKTNETVWGQVTSSLVHDADGAPSYFLSVIQDVTAEQEAQRHLERLNRLYRVLVSSGGAAETTRAPSELYRRVVDIATSVGGFPVAAVLLQAPDGRVVPVAVSGEQAAYVHSLAISMTDPAMASRPICTALRTREPDICADIAGDPRMAPWRERARAFNLRSSAAFPILSGDTAIGVFVVWTHQEDFFKLDELGLLGSVAHILSSAVEAHTLEEEKRLAVERLQKSEAQYRRLVESSHDIIWEVDAEGRITFINDATTELYGYTPEELIGRPFFEIVPPEQLAIDREAFTRSIAEGHPTIEYESQVMRRDGAIVHLLATAHVLRGPDGQVTGITGVSKDVTERVEAQRRLEEQAALLDVANDAILVKDLEGRILFWNRGAERTFGWTAEEAVGRTSPELLRPDEDAYATALRRLHGQGEWSGELSETRRDGRPVVVDCRWSLLRDPSGAPKSVLAIETDITERKELQRNAFRTQRLENLGTLAGGIAHDLNNVFLPLFLATDLLRLSALPAESRDLVATIERAARRGADLVEQILTFARGVERDRVELDPQALVADVVRVVHETFPKSIQVHVETGDDLGTIIGDPTQYHQVLLNLCVNARDAMPKGGTLRIGVWREWLDEVYLTGTPNARPGEWVRFEVRDTGVGIPREIRERIFEPFFTTKEVGKGTGLGLSTVIGIVRSHGGFVTVESEERVGTTFKVFLPVGLAGAGSAAMPAATDVATPRGKEELILLVDDEEAVRRLGQRTLVAHGYRVLTAEHGADAIAKFALHRDDVALVITDMAMPIMDGAATVVALRSLKPGVRVIGSSGEALEEGWGRAHAVGLDDVLSKPYTGAALLAMVHRVLHRERPPGGELGPPPDPRRT